jgi:hypothetical protein
VPIRDSLSVQYGTLWNNHKTLLVSGCRQKDETRAVSGMAKEVCCNANVAYWQILLQKSLMVAKSSDSVTVM